MFNISQSEEKLTPNIAKPEIRTSVLDMGMDAKTLQLNGRNFFSSLNSGASTSKNSYVKVGSEKPEIKNFCENYIPFGMWPEMSIKK